MPKKIIKVAEAKARSASAKVAGSDLRTKAVGEFSSKSERFVEVARTATERASDTLADASTSLVTSGIGQKAQGGMSVAIESLRPITNAAKTGFEIGSDAWGELNSSPLIVGVKQQTNAVSARIGAKIGSRESEMAAVAFTLHAVIDNLAGAEIAGDLVPKFRAAGIRGEWRSPAEARAFFDSSVPDHIQMLGADRVREFLADKDLSHIESFKNNPSRVSDPTNVIWESAAANRSRGAEDMT